MPEWDGFTREHHSASGIERVRKDFIFFTIVFLKDNIKIGSNTISHSDADSAG